MSLPILGSALTGGGGRQKTLVDYFPFWMQECEDWKTQNEIQDTLTKEEQKEALIMMVKTCKRWGARIT